MFHFTVRLELDHGAERERPAGAADVPHGLRALVVDDNATNRQIVEAYLRASDVRVQQAASGAEALASMHAARRDGEAFDLVITDFQMPGLNGIELARAIGRDAPASARHACSCSRPPATIAARRGRRAS